MSGSHKILQWWEGMHSEYETTRWLGVLEHWLNGRVCLQLVIANDSSAGLEEEPMMWWSCV